MPIEVDADDAKLREAVIGRARSVEEIKNKICKMLEFHR